MRLYTRHYRFLQVMSFEQFIATHHIADFAWKIFKGVSPTLVALFTIWINTRIGKKKTEKETFTNEIKELQTRLTEFASIVVETGEYLLETIQNSDDEQNQLKCMIYFIQRINTCFEKPENMRCMQKFEQKY